MKGECTEVSRHVGVQEKKSAQEKSRVHRRMQNVFSIKLRGWEEEEGGRERERGRGMEGEGEGAERAPLSLENCLENTQKGILCIFIMHLPDIPASS